MTYISPANQAKEAIRKAKSKSAAETALLNFLAEIGYRDVVAAYKEAINEK